MKWTPGYRSDDVEDRRGQRAGGGGNLGGILQLLPILMRSKFGWVGILVLLAFGYFRGSFGGLPGSRAVGGGTRSTGTADKERVEFVSFVLDDVQKTWEGVLPAAGQAYRRSRLVLFTDATQTGCGFGEAATGPFYCPADQKVYIDLGFFSDLAERLGAHGDFAQAYVVAHEIGHHVQKLLGVTERKRREASPSEIDGANGVSVRIELQADCYAGVWAHYTGERKLLEAGDVEEAMKAAESIGDDRLQKQARGTVNPESWTHGSSAQRMRWFKRGLDGGKPEACDTFAASASGL